MCCGELKSIVIDIHVQFGVIEVKYEDRFIGSHKTNEIVSFRITKLGKTLIESIAMSYF